MKKLKCKICKLQLKKLELNPNKKYLLRVGDENHEPDMISIELLAKELKRLGKINVIIVPYFIKSEDIEFIDKKFHI